MSPSTRKKVLIGAGGVIGVLIVALLIAPSFFDLNTYKPLIFCDSKAGVSVVADKANFSASVGSLDGPYGLEGGATVNGAPLRIDLSVGAKGANGHTAGVALEAGGGKLSFKGTLSELGPNASLAGIASISADSLTIFISTLVSLAGQPAPALPPLLASKFSFDGGIEVSQTKFAAKDFKLALAGDSGSG